MDEKLLTLVLNSGVASERREPCEWLDLKSRVEEEKYRQFSADLERRRIRKYNTHLEEQRKVEKELDNLQKDRLRFEREKQLRKRKSFSASRGKRQASKSLGKESNITLPMNEDALGGSASIAFDPKVEKYSRRRRRKAKTETFTTNSRRAEKELTDHVTSFPYLSEGEVKRFHKSCKSAAKSTECRRWGAAWLYAKKEKETTMNNSERWTTLLLHAEREKMRVLCEKLIALKERKIPKALECWRELGRSSLASRTSLANGSKYLATEKFNKLVAELESKNVMVDKENAKKNIRNVSEKEDKHKKENSLNSAKGQPKKFSTSKQQNLLGIKDHSRKVKEKNEFLFLSPFSKGILETKTSPFEQDSLKENSLAESFQETSTSLNKKTKQPTLLQDVTSEVLRRKNETGTHTVKFLPEL